MKDTRDFCKLPACLTVYDVNNSTKKVLYGQMCEHCEGTVRPKQIDREAFKHRKGFIILEGITVGVCDVCGMRYYSAEILHAVHDVATGAKPHDRLEKIPVSHLP